MGSEHWQYTQAEEAEQEAFEQFQQEMDARAVDLDAMNPTQVDEAYQRWLAEAPEPDYEAMIEDRSRRGAV